MATKSSNKDEADNIDSVERKKWLAKAQDDRWALKSAPEEIKKDFEIVLAAAQCDGWTALQTADKSLRSDPKIVLAAVKNRGAALEHASKNLRDNPEIAIEAIKQERSAFAYVGDKCKANRDVMMTYFESARGDRYGSSDIYSSMHENLKTDRELLLLAVESDRWAFYRANDVFKSDREILLTTLRASCGSYNALSAAIEANDEFAKDREVWLEAMNNSEADWSLWEMDESLLADRELMLLAIEQGGYTSLRDVSKSLKSDRELVLVAVKKNGRALEYASEELKADREVVLVAVKQDGMALCHADSILRGDQSVIQIAVEQNSDAIRHAEEDAMINYAEGLKTNSLGIPQQCVAHYSSVQEEEHISCDFYIEDEEDEDESTVISGYMIAKNKSGAKVTWHLPNDACLSTLEAIKWTFGCHSEGIGALDCDDHEVGSSEGCIEGYFDDEDNPIEDYDYYDQSDSEVISQESIYEPNEIVITYDSGLQIEFSPASKGLWKANLMSGTVLDSMEIADYKSICQVVKYCLEGANSEDTFVSVKKKVEKAPS